MTRFATRCTDMSHVRQNSLRSVSALEDFGRVRLSKSFFMRDFLYSEISQIHGVPNVPANPALAIEVGRQLCEKVLEPIQDQFGRICIRSAFRATAVNSIGAANRNQHSCARNDANLAGHIWDRTDAEGLKGATACIVVPAFLPYYERTGDWAAMAWWVHDHVSDYSSMVFYPRLAAFNVSWHERPLKRIRSHVPPRGLLTRPGMENFGGNHVFAYNALLQSL